MTTNNDERVCECGNQRLVAKNSLVNGDTRSCGCLLVDSNKARARKAKECRVPDEKGGEG